MNISIKKSILALTLTCSFNAVADHVFWNQPEAMDRLASSEHKVDFPKLSVYFEPQENKTFCGVASASIVLNALRVMDDDRHNAIPLDSTQMATHEMAYLPNGGGNVEHSDKTSSSWSPLFQRYTQNTVLINSPKPRIEILGKPAQGSDLKDYGLQLDQFDALIKSNGASITTYELAKDINTESIKAHMIEVMKTPNAYLVINYAREKMNQPGGGHFSPIGAYDEETDSFLVMDVNNADYLWHWAAADTVIKAMHTFDIDAYRGYSVITEKS